MVSEFNETWADKLGYQVELMGWEETIPGYGRPQHLINQDLDRCDLFIGMIWKRWGTQPDADGKYTSGFHEEFDRSAGRLEQSGRPEMALFFKTVPDAFLVDPGLDLKRVLDFKDSVISERRFLFQTFSTVREMEALARKCITAYVNRVGEEDTSSEAPEDRARRATSKNTKESVEASPKGTDTSPLSAEGFEFLRQLVDRLREDQALDNLTASDVARFRLLANSISKPGNDKIEVGVHDINILFAAHAQDIRFGRKETRTLTSLGFHHLHHENVPL